MDAWTMCGPLGTVAVSKARVMSVLSGQGTVVGYGATQLGSTLFSERVSAGWRSTTIPTRAIPP